MKTIRKSLTAALMMAISLNATQTLEAGCHGKSRSHSSGHVSSYPSRSYPSHSYPSQSYPSSSYPSSTHSSQPVEVYSSPVYSNPVYVETSSPVVYSQPSSRPVNNSVPIRVVMQSAPMQNPEPINVAQPQPMPLNPPVMMPQQMPVQQVPMQPVGQPGMPMNMPQQLPPQGSFPQPGPQQFPMPNSNGQVSQMPMPQGQPNGPMMQSMPMNPMQAPQTNGSMPAPMPPQGPAMSPEQQALEALGAFAPPQPGNNLMGSGLTVVQPLIGSWVAQLANGASVRLNLQADGQFSWTATNAAGSTTSFSGRFTIAPEGLSLIRSGDNQTLSGATMLNGSDAFSFRLQGSNMPNLEFRRG